MSSTTNSTAATPLVRRLADQLGVNLIGIYGSGAGGRITERDVRAAAAFLGDVRAAARGAVVDAQARTADGGRPATAAEDELYRSVYGPAPQPTYSAAEERLYRSVWPEDDVPALDPDDAALYASVFGDDAA